MGIKHVFGQTNILHPRSGSSQDEREQDEAEKSLASIPVTTVTSTGVQQADQCLAGLAERTNILVWDYAPNPGEDLEEGYTIRVIPRSASVEREDLRPESPHGSIHDHSARFEPVTNRDKAYSESFKKHPEWIAWQEQNLDGTSTRPPNGPPIPGTKRKRSDPEPGRNESPPRKVAKSGEAGTIKGEEPSAESRQGEVPAADPEGIARQQKTFDISRFSTAMGPPHVATERECSSPEPVSDESPPGKVAKSGEDGTARWGEPSAESRQGESHAARRLSVSSEEAAGILHIGHHALDEHFRNGRSDAKAPLVGTLDLKAIWTAINHSIPIQRELGVDELQLARWAQMLCHRLPCCDEQNHDEVYRAQPADVRLTIRKCEHRGCTRGICNLCRSTDGFVAEIPDLTRRLVSTCMSCVRKAQQKPRTAKGKTTRAIDKPCRCVDILRDGWHCRFCRLHFLSRVEKTIKSRQAILQLTRLRKGRMTVGREPRQAPVCSCGRVARTTQRKLMFCLSCDGYQYRPQDDAKYPSWKSTDSSDEAGQSPPERKKAFQFFLEGSDDDVSMIAEQGGSQSE